MKYLTAGIGDGKFTDEIDDSVRKSPSMVAREMHLQGHDVPWYVMFERGVREYDSLTFEYKLDYMTKTLTPTH